MPKKKKKKTVTKKKKSIYCGIPKKTFRDYNPGFVFNSKKMLEETPLILNSDLKEKLSDNKHLIFLNLLRTGQISSKGINAYMANVDRVICGPAGKVFSSLPANQFEWSSHSLSLFNPSEVCFQNKFCLINKRKPSKISSKQQTTIITCSQSGQVGRYYISEDEGLSIYCNDSVGLPFDLSTWPIDAIRIFVSDHLNYSYHHRKHRKNTVINRLLSGDYIIRADRLSLLKTLRMTNPEPNAKQLKKIAKENKDFKSSSNLNF